jgi:hypothetical protein
MLRLRAAAMAVATHDAPASGTDAADDTAENQRPPRPRPASCRLPPHRYGSAKRSGSRNDDTLTGIREWHRDFIVYFRMICSYLPRFGRAGVHGGCTMSTAVPGEWLSIPGEPPAARAFIPKDRSEDFATEPAIEWQGSFGEEAVAAVTVHSLFIVPGSRCTCEIWSDEPTVPEPHIFTPGNAGEIGDYVRGWSSRANVSLSICHPSYDFPMIYIWGALREGKSGPMDEVGLRLHRRVISDRGVELVGILYSKGDAVARPDAFTGFVEKFRVMASE